MTSFKPPFRSQLTPHAEINNFIKNTEEYLTGLSEDLNTAFAEVPQMSETPQRIGTWVDGSPVYRKAFDVLLKDMSEVDYADALSNTAFTVATISDSGSAYPISTFCAYVATNGTLHYCGISTLTDTAVDFGLDFGVTIPEDQSYCTTEHYYGYIDFIQTGDAE